MVCVFVVVVESVVKMVVVFEDLKFFDFVYCLLFLRRVLRLEIVLVYWLMNVLLFVLIC